MKSTKWLPIAALTMSVATFAAACGGSDEDTEATGAAGGSDESVADTPADTPADEESAAGGEYVIGLSNTVSGNGWRDRMVCAVKAEALASGQVSEVITISKNGGPTEQIQDLQNLISQGVDAIVVNPSDREALNPVIEEAIAQGIVVVAVDQAVTAEGAYIVANDQVAYGRLGMEALVEEIGAEGEVLIVHGIDGNPANEDREAGIQEVLDANPGITATTVYSDWDFTRAGELAIEQVGAKDFAGIWTSGIDYTVFNAFETVGKPAVPIVGADNFGWITELAGGAPGFAVTNPAVVGGAGVNVALQVLNGDEVEPETLFEPEVLSSGDPALEELNDPEGEATNSAAVSIEGLTTFSPDELATCAGPGE